MDEELRFRPTTWGSFLGYLGSALLIGVVIGTLLWLSAPHGPLGASLLIGAWVGLWIFLIAMLLALLFEKGLQSLRGVRRVAALAAMMVLAGAGGWALAAHTLPWVTLGHLRMVTHDWRIALAFAATVGLTSGLAVYTYVVLRQRLEASLARERENAVAQRQLEDARALQRRLLPPRSLSGPGYEIRAHNAAAELVAGDFYDVFPWPGGGLGLAVADVAGKGMAASLIMATVKARLPLVAAETVGETLRRLNGSLRAELGPREFVALCLARYDPGTGSLELANAAMPDPYRLGTSGSVEAVAVNGPRLPLGVREEVAYEGVHLDLAVGDRLLMFSDGLPETAVGDDVLGYDGLLELFPGPLAAGLWLDRLFERLDQLGGSAPDDDRTALLLGRTA